MTDDPLAALMQLKPVRDLPESERQQLGLSRQGRGRPRRIAPAPGSVDDYRARLNALRGQALDADPVVTACRAPETKDPRVIDETMLGIAREAAALGWDRREAERRGADASQTSSRRISALSTLASLVVERARSGAERELNVRDPKLAKIVDLFVGDLTEVAEEVLGVERAKTFVEAYKSKTEGWQDRIDPPRAPPEK